MNKIATTLVGLLAASALVAGCGTSSADTASQSPIPVTYTAVGGNSPGGHGGLVDVTYSDGSGGTVQEMAVPDGWTKTITANRGQTLTFSVVENRNGVSILGHQLGAAGEPTSCAIDGLDTPHTVSSTGTWAVATCSALVN
jgi:hypothetical protein